MANASTAFGFRQMGGLPGNAPTFEMSAYAIQSTFATPISFCDPVAATSISSQYIVNTFTTGALTATTYLAGIFVGCQYTPKSGGGVVWSQAWPGAASATDAVAYVVDNPNALFLAASIGTGAITSSQIGLNIGYAINSLSAGISTNAFTGNNLASAFLPTGISPFVLDQTSIGTTNTLPFRIVGLFGPYFGNFANNGPGMYGGVGNGSDPTTTFNWAVVTFNQQAYRAGVAGR